MGGGALLQGRQVLLQKHWGQRHPTKGGGIWGNTENRAKSFKMQFLSFSSIPNIHLKGQKNRKCLHYFGVPLFLMDGLKNACEKEPQHYAII